MASCLIHALFILLATMATEGGYYTQYIPGDHSTPVDQGGVDRHGHEPRYCPRKLADGTTCNQMCNSDLTGNTPGKSTYGKFLYMCPYEDPESGEKHGFTGCVGEPIPDWILKPKRQFNGPSGGPQGPTGALGYQQRAQQAGQVQQFSLVEIKEGVKDLSRELQETKAALMRVVDQVGMLFAQSRAARGDTSQVQQAQQQQQLPVAQPMSPPVRSGAPAPARPMAYPGTEATTDIRPY